MKDVEPDDIEIESDSEEGSTSREAETKIHKLKEEIESLRKEKQEYLDGWQRSKADYVNLLKRSEVDNKVERLRGRIETIESLLPAYDALERAKEHGEVPAGFQAIAKQIESTFKTLGLEELGRVGERFDPALHEALGQDRVDEEKLDDTLTVILEKGYRLGDIVLRPAKVRVGHF